MKIDHKENNKKKIKKKLFLIPLFLFLGVGIVFAAWTFSYNNTIQATIIGEEVLLVIEEISDFNVETINGSVNNSQTLSLFNKNGVKFTNLNFTVNKVLTEMSCPNYINDCSVEFKNSTGVVNSGNEIVLFSGFNNFTIETMCVQNSCGQNISIEVDIQ